jgi:hypothetical protein
VFGQRNYWRNDPKSASSIFTRKGVPEKLTRERRCREIGDPVAGSTSGSVSQILATSSDKYRKFNEVTLDKFFENLSKSSRLPANKKFSCWNCGSPKHMAAFCPKVAKSVPDKKSPCSYCGSSKHMSSGCDDVFNFKLYKAAKSDKKNRCFNCTLYGHMARDCPYDSLQSDDDTEEVLIVDEEVREPQIWVQSDNSESDDETSDVGSFADELSYDEKLEDIAVEQPVKTGFSNVPCNSDRFAYIEDIHCLPKGHIWEWYDNYEDHLTHLCRMTIVNIYHGMGLQDGRPDCFTGANLDHPDPVFAEILYERIPVLRLFEFNDKHRYIPGLTSIKTWLCVSMAKACQLMTANNITMQMDHKTIYTRLTQSVKNIAKVNDNIGFTLTGNLVPVDTISFAWNLVRFYLYQRRNLVQDLDFIK